MPKKRKVIVTQERNVRTYAELLNASKRVLEVGLREPTGSSWLFLSSIVLTAFAFEAYMNHVGAAVLSSWKHLERLPPLAKLDLLCEMLKVKLPSDKGERPQQTITTLFQFRNTLAHGRTETIRGTPKRLDPEKVDEHFRTRLLNDWEKLIKNSKFAKRARDDVNEIIKAINTALPEPREYPFTSGLAIGSATLEQT
jgi:hypothetical protein